MPSGRTGFCVDDPSVVPVVSRASFFDASLDLSFSIFRLLSVSVTTAARSPTLAVTAAVPSAVSFTSSPPSLSASAANSLNPSFKDDHMAWSSVK